MQSITSKVASMLLLIAITSNIVNAQSIATTKGETNAIIWASVVVMLSILITYARVCKQKKIQKEEKDKLDKEIKRNI